MQLPRKNDLFSVYQQVSSKVKQYAKNLTPIELRVEEATSNEPWGPHGTAMAGQSGQRTLKRTATAVGILSVSWMMFVGLCIGTAEHLAQIVVYMDFC